jgi:hypothetical protein
MPAYSTPAPEIRYNSAIAKWDEKSAVRVKPRRCLAQGDADLPFSAKLTPAVSHPLLTGHDPDDPREFLTRRLYSYLDFTTILEQEIVNPTVLQMSRDAYGLRVPDGMRFDAYRIYCDEAYHALMSADVKWQVKEATGVTPTLIPEPAFVRAIRQAKDSMPAELAPLVEFCSTVVSETLISGTLTQIPEDTEVLSFVREAIADHAADERTHHAYFTRAFEIAWPQFGRPVQQSLAPLFADLIIAFLAPDLDGQRNALWQMGFNREESAQIVWEANPADRTIADIRHAARSTLRLLSRMGVMQYRNADQRFYELGLISDEKESDNGRRGIKQSQEKSKSD